MNMRSPEIVTSPHRAGPALRCVRRSECRTRCQRALDRRDFAAAFDRRRTRARIAPCRQDHGAVGNERLGRRAGRRFQDGDVDATVAQRAYKDAVLFEGAARRSARARSLSGAAGRRSWPRAHTRSAPARRAGVGAHVRRSNDFVTMNARPAMPAILGPAPRPLAFLRRRAEPPSYGRRSGLAAKKSPMSLASRSPSESGGSMNRRSTS